VEQLIPVLGVHVDHWLESRRLNSAGGWGIRTWMVMEVGEEQTAMEGRLGLGTWLGKTGWGGCPAETPLIALAQTPWGSQLGSLHTHGPFPGRGEAGHWARWCTALPPRA